MKQEDYGDFILSFIPTGSKNAIKRKWLCTLTGLRDRVVRDMIHHARHKMPIINLSKGKGYYFPDMNQDCDRQLLIRYVRQEESRVRNIIWALAGAKRTLKNCGIDWRIDEQQEKRGRGRKKACKKAS